MKYCMKCGAELFDEAVVCVKCGTLVANITPAFSSQPAAPVNQAPLVQANQRPAAPKAKRPTVFLLTSDFIYKIMLCVSLFFSAMCIALGEVETTLTSSSKSSLGVRAASAFTTNEGLAFFALIFGFITLMLAITSFVATLVDGHKAERVLSSISKVVVGIFLLFGTLALLGNS